MNFCCAANGVQPDWVSYVVGLLPPPCSASRSGAALVRPLGTGRRYGWPAMVRVSEVAASEQAAGEAFGSRGAGSATATALGIASAKMAVMTVTARDTGPYVGMRCN